MPELPEVEIITQNLAKEIEQKEIISCRVGFGKLIKNMDPLRFESNLAPFFISAIHRKGKYMVFEDEKHSKWLTVHLGMTGAFFPVKSIEEIPTRFQKHLHLTFYLDDDSILAYCDIRKFGDIRLFNESPYLSYEPFVKMGPDPLNERKSLSFLEKSRSKLFVDKEIKPSLLDSRLISGVGNIYACEVLFQQGIHPARSISTLTDKELTSLYEAITLIFQTSIAQGGSSVSDYVNSKGESGKFQDFHQIYQKDVCSVCGNDVSKTIQNKRSTFHCETCQPFNKK